MNGVMIERNVDQAFIVSLLMIVDEINHNQVKKVVIGVTNAALKIGKVAAEVVKVGIDCLDPSDHSDE
ncbi:hypothetical protein Lalb_Chr01g0023531 [Lupinus albus]|uniref:Uncharacterized protein n=1 Tax=Lupinus albus TaxID=3870 RepID=A0A6A4RC87_LUPAL|nr:hypothetical protein Lalb_Chr01g0023531 [Lupinus albus]